jgi:hypothetical protein
MTKGEQLKAGIHKPIKWIGSEDIRSVNIDYTVNGGKSWIRIANNITSNKDRENVFNWEVPNASSNNCLIKISDTGGIYTATSKRFVVER